MITRALIVVSFLALSVKGLERLCPLPPYDDDVHINCALESGVATSEYVAVDISKLSVVEYNIDRNGYGGDGSSENGLSPIVDLLSNPTLVPTADVLVLVEVARGCSSYGGIEFSGAKEIAKALNMNYYYAVEYVDIDQSDNATVECTMGNALLSKYSIENIQQLRFESQCCRYGGRYGGRIDLIGDIVVNGTILAHVHSAHLESGQSNVEMVLESIVVRERQAEEMTKVVYSSSRDSRSQSNASSVPVIIAGDLNSPFPKIDPTIVRLERSGFIDSFENITIENRDKFQLDYLLSSVTVMVEAGYCTASGCEGWSDHVPYWATLPV